jgi:hypothetical protein
LGGGDRVRAHAEDPQHHRPRRRRPRVSTFYTGALVLAHFLIDIADWNVSI